MELKSLSIIVKRAGIFIDIKHQLFDIDSFSKSFSYKKHILYLPYAHVRLDREKSSCKSS